MTDGQEALEIGTAPLAPDTDGDGILDGDEVAQGTDPLDGVAGSILEEAPVDEGDGADRTAARREESPRGRASASLVTPMAMVSKMPSS